MPGLPPQGEGESVTDYAKRVQEYLDNLKAEVASIEALKTKANEALQNLNDNRNIVREEISTLQLERNNVAQDVTDSKKELNNLHSDVIRMKQTRTAVGTEISQYRDEIKDLKDDREELKVDIERLKAEKADLEEDKTLPTDPAVRELMEAQQKFQDKIDTLFGGATLDPSKYTAAQMASIRSAAAMSKMAAGLENLNVTLGEFKGDQDTTGTPITDEERLRRHRKIPPPIFKGIPGERPEAHLLRAQDWMDAIGISKFDDDLKNKNFKYTLDGLAREWYDQYDFITLTKDFKGDYKKFAEDFSRYFSCQGRSMKHLHDRWKSFVFDPESDDIEEFIRNVQETGVQLRYGDEAVLNMIKSCMPTAIYSTLYDIDNLHKCITMVKDIYAKNPAELHRQAAAVASGGTPSPFTAIQSKMGKTQLDYNQISEVMNALELQNKPYKPQIAPRANGRGRGARGRGSRGRSFEFAGRGKAYFSQDWNPNYTPRGGNRGAARTPQRGGQNRGRGRGGRGGRQRYDKSPSKNKGRMKQPTIDADRCLKCKQIGHWAKDCPVKDEAEDNNSGYGLLNDTFYQHDDDLPEGLMNVYYQMTDGEEEEDMEISSSEEAEDLTEQYNLTDEEKADMYTICFTDENSIDNEEIGDDFIVLDEDPMNFLN